MVFNFYIDKKVDSDKGTIYLYVRDKSITLKFNSGQRLLLKAWDEKKQRCKSSYSNSMGINHYLDNFKKHITNVCLTVSANSSLSTLKQLKPEILQLLEQKEKFVNFFDVFDEFLSFSQSLYAPNTYQKFPILKTHLQNFEKYSKTDIQLRNINTAVLESFVIYCVMQLNHMNNTVYKNISLLKWFLNWASKRGYDVNNSFRDFKTKEDEREIIYLTEKELMKLVDLELSNLRLAKARDIFCFACFTGARFSDVKNLKQTDISEDTWNLRTLKTNDIIDIPLSTKAKELLQRVSFKNNNLVSISNQKMNEYIKEVAVLAEIDTPIKIVKYSGAKRIENIYPKHKLITMHVARKTFVTLSLEKGLRPETLMEITGHKDYRVMKKYIKITSKVKENEFRKAWG